MEKNTKEKGRAPPLLQQDIPGANKEWIARGGEKQRGCGALSPPHSALAQLPRGPAPGGEAGLAIHPCNPIPGAALTLPGKSASRAAPHGWQLSSAGANLPPGHPCEQHRFSAHPSPRSDTQRSRHSHAPSGHGDTLGPAPSTPGMLPHCPRATAATAPQRQRGAPLHTAPAQTPACAAHEPPVPSVHISERPPDPLRDSHAHPRAQTPAQRNTHSSLSLTLLTNPKFHPAQPVQHALLYSQASLIKSPL